MGSSEVLKGLSRLDEPDSSASLASRELPEPMGVQSHGREEASSWPSFLTRTRTLIACTMTLSLLGTLGLRVGVMPSNPCFSTARAGDTLRGAVEPLYTVGGGVEDHAWGLPPEDSNVTNPGLLLEPEVLVLSPDACAQALNIPKVALLFLSKADLPLASMWALWFASAAGATPLASWHAARCSSQSLVPGLKCACDLSMTPTKAAQLPSDAIVAAQHLFSVYVHVPLEFNASEVSPLFRHHVVSRRTSTEWGSPLLSVAYRYMLWEAYRDPQNQRFCHLSESDIPLYGPIAFHQQLMAEPWSRVDGCRPDGGSNINRWVPDMESPGLSKDHWRKSMQWSSLVREHARVVLEDTHIFRQFERYCRNPYVSITGSVKHCLMDEHYLATLFAVHGIQSNVNCGARSLTRDDWSAGGIHPKTYKAGEVTASEILKARLSKGLHIRTYQGQELPPWHCDAAAMISGAAAAMTRLSSPPAQVCELPAPRQTMLGALPSTCRLTMRKMAVETAGTVLDLFTGCAEGLELLDPGLCRRQSPVAGSIAGDAPASYTPPS